MRPILRFSFVTLLLVWSTSGYSNLRSNSYALPEPLPPSGVPHVHDCERAALSNLSSLVVLDKQPLKQLFLQNPVPLSGPKQSRPAVNQDADR